MPSGRIIPLCTVCVIALCSVIHIVVSVVGINTSSFAISAWNVIFFEEWYRIFTSAFIHGNLVHIIFNMTSVAAISSQLEQSMGTIKIFFIICWSIFLGGLIHVFGQKLRHIYVMVNQNNLSDLYTIQFPLFSLSIIFFLPRQYAVAFIVSPKYAMDHITGKAVGFSGVIFSLAVIECTLSTVENRNLFGALTVPTKLYPWALMIALQVLVPNISFAGHLSGALVGLMHSYGITHILLPSREMIREMERMSTFSFIEWLIPYYKKCSEDSMDMRRPNATELIRGMRMVATGLLDGIIWTLKALLYMIGLERSYRSNGFQPVPLRDIELGSSSQ